jgi:23S rRNA (guanosine2251-2'-O)-methyltransferase
MSPAEEDTQWVGGWHAVLALLESRPGEVDTIWLAEGRQDRRARAVVAAARVAGVRLRHAPRAALDRLAVGLPHQGVLARLHTAAAARGGGEAELTAFLARLPAKPLLLALDGVQDPHNLGACLRTADAAGVHAVLVPRDRSAPLSPAARRAAAGAAETVPFFRLTNLARMLRTLKEAGLWVVGTAADAPRSLYETDLAAAGLVLVLGGEARGLRRLTREYCDFLVRIPMAGRVESLNVSVAAGVSLFEIRRQREAAMALVEPRSLT